MNVTLKQDIMLFECDLSEYTCSKQGKLVKEALRTENPIEIEKALGNYWDSRNGHDNKALEWDSEEERQNGKDSDDYYRQLYREQN